MGNEKREKRKKLKKERDYHGTIRPTQRITWGVAYRVHADRIEEVRNYLDYREKGGYTVDVLDVYSEKDHNSPTVKGALVYIGTEDNPNYLGPAPLEEIATQIATSEGKTP